MSIIGHFHAVRNFFEERSHLFNKVNEFIKRFNVLIEFIENCVAFGSGLNLGEESRSSHESFHKIVGIGDLIHNGGLIKRGHTQEDKAYDLSLRFRKVND